MTISLFTGYDEREAIGWHVFVSSVLSRTTAPVAIHPLDARCMPVGSTAFTYSRFLVPWLQDYSGHAIFCDGSDMLMLADVSELDALFDPRYVVQVVKHKPYKTRHPIKFLGTSMQCPNRDYEKKQWASVMIMNCSAAYWRAITPDTLAARAGIKPLQFEGLADSDIGALPPVWNCVIDENQPAEGVKILHWSSGGPFFKHYENAPGADLWRAQRDRMMEVDT